MKQVSKKQFIQYQKRFAKIYDLYCRNKFLRFLIKLFVPSKWYDIYQNPYYYYIDETTENCPEELKSYLHYIHSYVTFDIAEPEISGILIGFAVTMDDYYYVYINSSGKECWMTCVNSIKTN